MDPITQKIISLTKGAAIPEVSDVFQTYAWGKPDVASNGAAGIHTSLSTVDLTEGGMVMVKRWLCPARCPTQSHLQEQYGGDP